MTYTSGMGNVLKRIKIRKGNKKCKKYNVNINVNVTVFIMHADKEVLIIQAKNLTVHDSRTRTKIR